MQISNNRTITETLLVQLATKTRAAKHIGNGPLKTRFLEKIIYNVKMCQGQQHGTRGAAECVADVLTIFRHPTSITEQTYGNIYLFDIIIVMSSIRLSPNRL